MRQEEVCATNRRSNVLFRAFKKDPQLYKTLVALPETLTALEQYMKNKNPLAYFYPLLYTTGDGHRAQLSPDEKKHVMHCFHKAKLTPEKGERIPMEAPIHRERLYLERRFVPLAKCINPTDMFSLDEWVT